MTPALATPPGSLLGALCESGGTARGGRLTLEERLRRALDTARGQGAAECPVCCGRMAPAADGAACRDCGSVLH